jgi:hypothetical protein
MKLLPSTHGIDIERLVKEACARFDALTLEQQREHRRAQRKSWVIGEMLLEHPDMTREYVENIWNGLDL